MNKKIGDLAEKLLGKNIKPSPQRIKILEYLMNKRNHPTVDRIYNDLLKDIPTLSKATVYNALDLFKKENLAIVVTIEDNETRYDGEVTSHGHFKCDYCGSIYNFSIDVDKLSIDSLENFKINEKNVYFKGVCPKCLKT